MQTEIGKQEEMYHTERTWRQGELMGKVTFVDCEKNGTYYKLKGERKNENQRQ